MKPNKWIGPGLLAAVLTVSVTACADSDPRSPAQVWIDDHPTHVGPLGDCIEWDGEPCDADPNDLDDFLPGPDRASVSPRVSKSAAPKVSPRPVRTAFQPAPKTTRRR